MKKSDPKGSSAAQPVPIDILVSTDGAQEELVAIGCSMEASDVRRSCRGIVHQLVFLVQKVMSSYFLSVKITIFSEIKINTLLLP